MSIIGVNDVTGFSTSLHSVSSSQMLMSGFATLTPSVAEEITTLNVYNGADNTGHRMEVAVFDVTSGADGAPLITTAVINGGANGTLSTYTLPSPVAITASNIYCVAWSLDYEAGVSTQFTMLRLLEGSASNIHSTLTATSPLPSNWTAGSTLGFKYGVYADTQAVSAQTPTITDVNTDEIVELGSAGNVITGTNFEASQGTGQVRINTQSDGLGTDLVVTETVWSDISITFTVPVGLPPGTAYVFVQNDSGQENATGFAITLTVPSGYEFFVYDGTTLDPNTTESIQEDAAKAPTDGYGLTMASSDVVIIETTGATWSVNGSYTQSSPTNETAIYYVWDATASTMYGQSSPVTVTLAVKPTLSGALLTNTGSSNSLSWQFTTDFDVGDYHTYVSSSATPPSTTDHQNGTGAVYYTTAAVSAAGVISGTATGLNPSTTYYLHGLHVNNGVLSDQITSAGVATNSTGSTIETVCAVISIFNDL